MSRFNTLPYTMSDVLSQQQISLKNLYALQNHTRSLTTDVEFQNDLLKNEFLAHMYPIDSSHTDTDYGLEDTQTLINKDINSNINNSPNKKKNNVNHNSTHIVGNNITATVANGENIRVNAKFEKDSKSPLKILIPTNAQAVFILAERFAAWRSVLKSLLIYLSETASVQDEIVQQQLRLLHMINFPFPNGSTTTTTTAATGSTNNNNIKTTNYDDKNNDKFFPVGSGSVQDIPKIFHEYHYNMVMTASKGSKELTNIIIPKLNELREDLLIKIKEIKSLQSDFKNSLNKELIVTKQSMKSYISSLNDAHHSSIVKMDPYLTKISLDRQIRKQINEENFLHEAFDNLQESGKQLEKIVVMEIQNSLVLFARILGQQSQLIFDILITKLDKGFLNMDPNFEWNSFLNNNTNSFVPSNLPMRRYSDIQYKLQNDPLTFPLRSGYISRRSKILKSYSKSYYVLTANFLHEFKTEDRRNDLTPIMSIPLTDCTIKEHSNSDTNTKLILTEKQKGLLNKNQRWHFAFDSNDEMKLWFNDLKKLTCMTKFEEKINYINSNAKK